ncbi:MAG: LptF/LptG family permease [Phycisphaeraceae bacterium]|nr:LptF/LptG family permease [Phycisphaeraceae bacterium]MCW5761877.1 LptF/LptG family permease [Phycisphaeraceae bacterium]
MSLLDRYIARQFFINVITLLLILFCFIVAIDASMNVTKFSKVADVLLESRGQGDAGSLTRLGTTLWIIADLWWPRLLQLYNFLIGMVMVGAMGFTCTQFVRHREFVAMLAAGQSLMRVARPVVIVALCFTVVQALNQELVIPRIAPLLSRDHKAAGAREVGTTSLPLTPDGSGRLFQARAFDVDRGELHDLFVLEYNAQGQPERAIRATHAVWDGQAWILESGTVEPRRMQAPPQPIERLTTGLSPEQIRLMRYGAYRHAMSFQQAGKLLERKDMLDERAAGDLQRVRWGRVSVWISNLLTLSIALPFFLTREPRSMIQQSLKCAPISISALVGGVLGASAAIPGIPPVLGVFVPVMILLPASIAVMSTVRT